MGISMSGGGPFSYNRFDEYQRLIEKKQGYNDREDESLGERDGKESGKKQSEKDRRDEAKGEAKSEGKPDYIDIDKDGDGTIDFNEFLELQRRKRAIQTWTGGIAAEGG